MGIRTELQSDIRLQIRFRCTLCIDFSSLHLWYMRVSNAKYTLSTFYGLMYQKIQKKIFYYPGPKQESAVCIPRSLSVGIFISMDYWWTTNVALRGMDQVGYL